MLAVGDLFHPVYGVDNELYDIVKEVYEFVMSLETYTDGTTSKVEVAILRNKITHHNLKNY